jgi:hypothetical protein
LTQSRTSPFVFAVLLSTAIVAQIWSLPFVSTPSDEPKFAEPRTWSWSATNMKVLFLGHDIFAANVAWSSALIYFGDWRLSRSKATPRHLFDYAELIASLDPDFKPIYFWLSTTYINSRPEIGMRDLHRVADFIEQGMERFPSDCEFPFMAGSNYVGYSVERPARERLEEIARAVRYYERASLLEGCNPLLPFSLGYFYRRRRMLIAELERDVERDSAVARIEQIDFLKKTFLLSTDEDTRKRARGSLRALGLANSDIDALSTQYTLPLKRARAQTMPYLPLDHWTLIVAPPERSDDGPEDTP